MIIKGKVIYNAFEGGFWGIEGRDGQQYQPVNGIPAGFRREQLAVEVTITPSNTISFHMWGQPVHVRSIKKI